MRASLTLLLALASPARAADRVLFLVGESECGAQRTVPVFADQLRSRTDLECEVRVAEGRELPSLDGLGEFDLLVLFLSLREADAAQLARLDRWLDEGRAAVALRTTGHAFQDAPDWFPPHFGGRCFARVGGAPGTVVAVAPGAAGHSILSGVPRVLEIAREGIYDVQLLAGGAEVLAFGKSGELPARPIAWTFAPRPGARRVYLSPGSTSAFAHDGFRALLANAIVWALGRDVPPGGVLGGRPYGPPEPIPAPPDPPPLAAPADALVLFDGTSLAAFRTWDPAAEPPLGVDAAAPTSRTAPRAEVASDAPRWTVDGRALVARPGYGDLVTRAELGDVHVHLDFLIPPEPAWAPDAMRGASGVYVAGRWEVAILDSWQKDITDRSLGALHGVRAPARNAARPAGEWQSLDFSYTQRTGEPPRISAWVNDARVLTDAAPEEATAYGFLRPVLGATPRGEARFVAEPEVSAACDWGADAFAVLARFRTEQGGTLASKCPAHGPWVPNAKALFLRGGRLVYDIGWVGALTSRERFDDWEWHTVVLRSASGRAELWVDGALQAEREAFRADDEARFVLKGGAANEDFGGTYAGELEHVRFYADGLSEDEARGLSAGEPTAREPVLAWTPDPDAPPPPGPDEPLRGPLRLQAEGSPVRFANVWVRPLGEVDHAGLIASWGPESHKRGEAIYQGLCIACHGADGTQPTNPKARPFALGVLENGADPLSLFRTVTSGFKEMPGNAWLRPDQRYDVIHYVREEFLRERNPSQYFAVDDAYLNALPKGRVARPDAAALALPARDYGPALASQLGDEVGVALSVRLDDETTIAYDLQLMESRVWTGGFLDLSKTQHHQQRGEGKARPAGEARAGLSGWGFGHGGTLDWDRARRPDRGLLPRDWLDYHGHHVHGDEIVLAYAIDGREVLEVPGVDRTAGMPVITQRLWVGPSDDTSLELGPLPLPEGEGELQKTIESHRDYELVMHQRGERFVAAARMGFPGNWSSEDDRTVLRIAKWPEPGELLVLRVEGESREELRGFRTFLDGLTRRPRPASPRSLLGGGRARWPQELVTRGVLGDDSGAYALDTLTLPESNPWNAWLRTSALDFFDDGRAAVTTLGGDVWIVSGIDAELGELRWKRFAAGMFEPLGVRVVDGLVYVTCRDRITRLHDENGDGEADFYESFFADPDVSPNFHAFNFDLQTDAQGSFYYAKSGQYTDFALPGAILKVAPDGASHEVWCTGLRTPNGMGMSPDGRPLVSDNQGNWVPASKISLTREGGFYGVFKAIGTNTPGEKTRDDFDPPVLWMPQSLDSSSGGQLWVDDPRFGPLAGRYLHTSFGKGWVYPLVIDEVGGVAQGAAWRLPFQLAAGVQRARVNPADGQVYVVGLSGWQGPAGGADGCLQRLRYTGERQTLLTDARVRDGRVVLGFSEPLERAAAEDPARFRARRWEYSWARSYGSAHYSLEQPGEEGEDDVPVLGAALSEDGRTLAVELSSLMPVQQMVLAFELRAADGAPVAEEVFFTLHDVER